jgi:hydrogenase expression/formation protein HypE
MSAPIPPGKVPGRLLEELLRDALESHVLLGPSLGEDAAAITVPAGVLVAASDPITLTSTQVGAFAVDVNANDVAVMGVEPCWFLATVLLPVGTEEDLLRELFDGLYHALDRVGAVLVGGHAEVTPAVNQPVVVGQMLGLRQDGRYVRSDGLAPGDVVIQIGAAPIEGAAVLAAMDDPRLDDVDADVLRGARDAAADPGISVVAHALRAAELGATAMHDPTEGGLAAGLHELAAAAGVALEVDDEAVAWFGPGRAVCEAVGADPWATLASGCVLAAFRPQDAGPAIAGLRDAGYVVSPIATAVDGDGVLLADGTGLAWPSRDEVARLGQ